MVWEVDENADEQALVQFPEHKCRDCGHLEGDHEGPWNGKWSCDDDGCEDQVEECGDDGSL